MLHIKTPARLLGLAGLLVLVCGFKPATLKPTFFPQVRAFFKTLDSMPADPILDSTVRKLKATLRISLNSERNIPLLFACTDNSFRSLEAQILTFALSYSHKMERLKVYSAGYENTSIDPRLITLLVQHGFRVTEDRQFGVPAYKIEYGRGFPPLTVYAKGIKDASIPTSIFQTIKMCDSSENHCKNVYGSLFTASLPFTNNRVIESDTMLDNEFRAIAKVFHDAFRDIENK